MKRMTIFEFLKILETANGDQALDLISLFQCGGIEFTGINKLYSTNETLEKSDSP